MPGSRLNPALEAAMAPTYRVGTVQSDGGVVRARRESRADPTIRAGRLFVLLYYPATSGRPWQTWSLRVGIVGRSDGSVLAKDTRLVDVYERVRANAAADLPVWNEAGRMLDEFALPYYDADDPTEAAEQTLVALGAASRLLPAAIAAL